MRVFDDFRQNSKKVYINNKRKFLRMQICFWEWSRVRNAVCSKVIVIGPYPTCEFIDEIQNTLSPEALYVVVDESWKPVEIRKIQDKVGSDHVVSVRTKNGIGIVHAKIYFVEYSKLEKTFSRVFFGSVNAQGNL